MTFLQMKQTWFLAFILVGLGSSQEVHETGEDELMPLPEALKLIYPEFTLELDDIPLQLEDLEDLPLAGEDLEAKKRNFYLKKILRRKRQKPDFLRELEDRSKFIKSQLPVTELRRIQKEKPNIRLIRIIRNKKLDDDQLSTSSETTERFAPHFDSDKQLTPSISSRELPIFNPIVPAPPQGLQPPKYEFSPAQTTTTFITTTTSTTTIAPTTTLLTSPPSEKPIDSILQEATGTPISFRSPRMNHVMAIQKRFNDKIAQREFPELTEPLRRFIRTEVQTQICEFLYHSSPETCESHVQTSSARPYPYYHGYPPYFHPPPPYAYTKYDLHGGFRPLPPNSQ